MTTATTDVLAAGRAFIGHQGRLLEQRHAKAAFDGAPPDGALAALRAYRNGDGGFGHGLEPDKLCPDSLPIDDQIALAVMDDLGMVDHDLAMGICDHLATLARDGAVPLATTVIEGYPRAAHWAAWTYVPDLNPTAGIAGLLHRHGVDHPWRDAATAWCWRILERDGLPGDAHALLNVTTFLAHVDDRGRAGAVAAGLADHLPGVAHLRIDPDDPAYGMTPLHYAPTPDSPWRRVFPDDLLAGHLDRMLRDQAADGGWTLTWEPPGTAATLAYRGIETLRSLSTLRAWGRC
jgi:hypothetical protein